MRRVAILVLLLLAVAAPAAADTEPSRLLVTATSDRCAGGLPVVDYTVTNLWPTAVSAQIWWVADASVYSVVGGQDLGPAPDTATGSFSLPYDFYATVTVYATATWPDGKVITNASWAIPVADCGATAPSSTTESTTTSPTTTAPTTTIGDGGGNGNGNGNGNGYGHATTTIAAG